MILQRPANKGSTVCMCELCSPRRNVGTDVCGGKRKEMYLLFRIVVRAKFVSALFAKSAC